MTRCRTKREERIRAFEQRCDGFEVDAFKHALHEGNEADRLVALFAPGRFTHEEIKGLLEPFLHSPIRKERWASAMVLGDQRDERAFALLGDQKYRIGMKLEEGKQQQTPVLETDWWNPVWSRAPFADRLPIVEMIVGRNWQRGAFGRDIQRHAPWLFEQQQSR